VVVQSLLLAAPKVAHVWPFNRTLGGVEQTFARRYRLTKTDEFSSVFGFRRAIRGKLLMLHYLPRAACFSEARLGVVVGKKLLKRAVDRNKVKRVIREQFRCVRTHLPPVDLVVRLAVKPVPLDGKMLAGDFLALLEKLQRPRPSREER
jgi:ribonuclease P protein component